MIIKSYINQKSIKFNSDCLGAIQDAINASGVEPLVDWLYKTYGLQVYKVTSKSDRLYGVVDMAYGDGLHVCSVYTSGNNDGDTVYCYESKYNAKQKASRGVSIYVRESVKLTSLKRAIKSVIPSLDSVNSKVCHGFSELPMVITNTVKTNGYKSKYELDENLIHGLLQHALGDSTSPIQHVLDRTALTNILRKWDQHDIAEAEKKQKIVGMLLDTPLYALGISKETNNSTGVIDYFLGIIKNSEAVSGQFDVVSSFTRVADISECPPTLQAMITMYKLRHEHLEKSVDFIAKSDVYDDDLLVISMPTPSIYYNDNVNLRGGLAWFLTPVN
jgi:hypothetical protein